MRARTNRYSFIGRDSQLSQIVDRVAELNRLLAIVRQAAPPELRDAMQGVAWSGSELLIAVSSGAVAARLRIFSPDMLSALQAQGWNATAIRPRVQVELQRGNPMRTKELSLPGAAVEAFSSLLPSLGSPELRDAVEQLLLHHQKGKK